ncbi:hypothetical protein ACPA9J_22435 [Pseudomonas aeruginosa]
MPPTGDDKTSIIVSMRNKPGALRAAGTVHNNGIDLTRIETRRRAAVQWTYVFFIDFVGHHKEPLDQGRPGEDRPGSRRPEVLGSIRKRCSERCHSEEDGSSMNAPSRVELNYPCPISLPISPAGAKRRPTSLASRWTSWPRELGIDPTAIVKLASSERPAGCRPEGAGGYPRRTGGE